ncbi:MAG TPA: class I SAM-dependent methyltransferase [Myxococcota bacterium]|nr:class I SAM-dependent methyltransferase [Myxococcota bacterium]
MPQPADALVDAVARRFARAGSLAKYYARGKLRHDPIYFALLERALVPDAARLLDLGCGQGILLALLVEARAAARAGHWPSAWPPPPAKLGLRGIERDRAEVRRARIAFESAGEPEAEVVLGDLRLAELPESDVVVAIDVIHYLERVEQERLLARVARALAPGGVFLLRVCDAAAGWRALLTRLGDRLGTLSKLGRAGPLQLRSAAEWRSLLEAHGLETELVPMSAGTPFANVLFTARRAAESAPRGAA